MVVLKMLNVVTETLFRIQISAQEKRCTYTHMYVSYIGPLYSEHFSLSVNRVFQEVTLTQLLCYKYVSRTGKSVLNRNTIAK